KFLPEGVAADPAQLAQFHNELRTARQVSHKNVVRVYDLGESDGRRFLTLEYVDGEDLASLLRRIGRFPQDRALAIARQLCAGVAAALPGGDPLAAALAAGETPSPEVLSAAAESEAIPVLTGIGLVTATLVCVIAYALISPRGTMASLAPLDKAPEVLADRARQALVDYGYTEAPSDTAQQFTIHPDFERWGVARHQTSGRWDAAGQPMAA